MRVLSIALAATLALVPARARAVPGPDSVAVLANASVPGSVAIAMRYAEARDVPARQVCALPMPATEDVSLDDFRAMIREPLERCLDDAGVLDRIEAVVIARGVPLRVAFDVAGAARRVSLAAALALWETTLEDGTELLGQDPGSMADCGGTPCLAARWGSAYRSGAFSAGFERTQLGVVHRPVLVTMLHGRTDADAMALIDRAIASEGVGAGAGEILFMDGADPARGALDREYDAVIADLTARGIASSRTTFAPGLAGRTLSSFFTGTASIGTTIEDNDYVPGALVDNLTSFGALPENFRESGEVQVSIARWVAAGATGVHGTTDEPLNNCFPSRRMMLDYTRGATLAESYFARMPYVYWHNLVLGDPMTAPYAERPEIAITLDGIAIGEPIAQGTGMLVDVDVPVGRVLAEVSAYVDGVRVGGSTTDGARICLAPELGADQQVLVVALLEDDLEGERRAAKGWRSFRADVVAGDGTCDPFDGDAGPPGADAGVPGDAGSGDAGTAPTTSGGCACGVARARGGAWGACLVLAIAIARRRR